MQCTYIFFTFTLSDKVRSECQAVDTPTSSSPGSGTQHCSSKGRAFSYSKPDGNGKPYIPFHPVRTFLLATLEGLSCCVDMKISDVGFLQATSSPPCLVTSDLAEGGMTGHTFVCPRFARLFPPWLWRWAVLMNRIKKIERMHPQTHWVLCLFVCCLSKMVLQSTAPSNTIQQITSYVICKHGDDWWHEFGCLSLHLKERKVYSLDSIKTGWKWLLTSGLSLATC